MFIPPPQLAQGRKTYTDAYADILSAYRRSPQTSASSVILLVAPDVDSLCAARMLASLFKQDDVLYRIIPISSVQELQDVKEELATYAELHALILINMGNFIDLPTPAWFGEFDLGVSIHVIDSSRPRSMANMFYPGENGERVILWDDGDAEKLTELRKAWETLEFEPLPDSDDEDSEDDFDDDEDGLEEDDDDNSEDENDDEDAENGSRPSGKRRSTDGNSKARKRRKLEKPVFNVTRDEVEEYKQRLNKYYYAGTSYGQSAASTIYILATVLERVDNDMLWLAILGLTYQYITARISRDKYEQQHTVYHDEVSRLNPMTFNSEESHSLNSVNADDLSVRPTEELRFMFFRHWNLYDAMYHSSYVASKLGIWKEKGRKRLTGLLAKMGFSIPQTQQPYSHMDRDLKKALVKKLDDVAPEYGLVELSYPSFMRCYGYHSQPLSAADAVESINSLLDFAGGARLEIELEGHRHGGEWFGGGKLWEADGYEKDPVPVKVNAATKGQANGADDPTEESSELEWWKKNFWSAYDSLLEIERLRKAIQLAMSVHRAIIRQGTSIIDKQDIRTMRNHRVVILTQGPDLNLFQNPSMLSRLALWLIDAFRDRAPATAAPGRTKRRELPFIVACLNETKGTYVVAGIMASPEFGDVRRNTFATNFLNASQATNTPIQHTSFNTNIVEIDEKDLRPFLEVLCHGT